MFSRTSKTNSETRSDLIGTLAPIILVNLLFSANPLSTLSWSLHFLLYSVFLGSVLAPGSDLLRKSWLSAKMFSRTSKTIGETRSEPQVVIAVALTFTLLFQLALSLTQVYLGHSIGGLMYYLGERSIAVGQPAVALGSFMDSVVLRAYGTFGHPNVLAGWSVVALLITIQLRKQRAVRRSDLLRKSWLSAKMFSRTSKTSSETRSDLFGIYFPLLLTTFIILLTESRSALIALFGLVIPFYLIRNLKARILYYSITLLLCYSLVPSLFTPPRADLSRVERLTLQGLSLSVAKTYPLFGTGANASISTYPAISPTNRLLQPDHNSFTLCLSWFGLFGVLATILILKSKILNLKSFIPIVPLLLLDHYLLTSPQGLFIFLLYLKLNYSHAQKNL